jgi:hypothetical protein
MARLYADEDFDRAVVLELRRLGQDVLTMQEDGCGEKGVPDHGVLALAKHTGRCVLTFNRRDFIQLHKQSADHKGIVVCTRDPDATALAARIYAELQARGDLAGQLVRVYRPP